MYKDELDVGVGRGGTAARRLRQRSMSPLILTRLLSPQRVNSQEAEYKRS